MIDPERENGTASRAGISEAQRMAKIRELLVGPAIADESARVDQSFGRLDELVKDQQKAIAALQARIQELEESQRVDMKRFKMRLMSLAEALLADEEDVRARVMENETLLHKLESDGGNNGSA